MQVNIILLGAGKGQRFQSSSPKKTGHAAIKQLAQINGKPLIAHCIDKLHQLLAQPHIKTLYVALGANKNTIQACLPQHVSVISSQHWPDGMGHTLAESVQCIKAQSSHILIALADHALIPCEHYQNLLNASKDQPNKIIATLCENKLMAPAIFPEKYFPQLVKLQGDTGAGKLLNHYASPIDAVVCNGAKFDIDTWSDLEQARLHLENLQQNSLHNCVQENN